MINLRTIKRFPQMAMVAGVIVISTGLFAFWWTTRPKAKPQPSAPPVVVPQKPAPPIFGSEDVGRLIVAGGDLVDVENGKVLAEKWLKGEGPGQIWFDPRTGKIIGKGPRGYARFNLDGSKDAELTAGRGLVVTEDAKRAVYAKDKEIWIAGVDWDAFKLIEEKRVTNQGIIMEQYFVENIQMFTPKVLMVRNLNQFLRINLESGEVTLTKTQFSQAGSRRSPDSRTLLGEMNEGGKRKFFAYDVETDETKKFDVESRDRATQFAWVSNDAALFLVGTQALWRYDRPANEITKVMDLPVRCSAMYYPSPSGRYIFCEGNQTMHVADTEAKTLQPVGNNAHFDWFGEGQVIYARETPDTNLQGTWIAKIGGEETRVSTDPFLISRNAGASFIYMDKAQTAVFGTRSGLFKLKAGETTPVLVVATEKPATGLQRIETWPY